MKPVNLKYNSLFIRNFRERMRPHIAGSYAALVLVTAALVIFVNRDHFTNVRWERSFLAYLPRWDTEEVFFALALIQGALLLVLGTLSAYRLTLMDRLNGILDLFRATPTSGADHVIGLVLGAPITEWLLFLLLTPVALVIAIMGGLEPGAVVSFYLSLVLCAVFYHSTAVLAGACASRKHLRETISFGLLFIILHALALIGSFWDLSVAYHATCLPAFGNLMRSIDDSVPAASLAVNTNLHLFFGAQVPSLLLQILIQVPLTAFACLATDRKLSSPDKPMLSRPQMLALTALIAVFFTGELSHFKELSRANNFALYTFVSAAYIFLFFALSIIFIVFGTPTALGYRQGLNRMKNLGMPELSLFDEQAGNTGWLLLYCGLVASGYSAVCLVFKTSLPASIASFSVLMVFVFWVASALEFSRLRFPGKETVFTTTFLLLWIAIPLAEMTTTDGRYPCLTFLSPLVTIPLWSGAVMDKSQVDFSVLLPQETSTLLIWIGHMCLILISLCCIYLARRERDRIRTEVFATGAPDKDPAVH